MKKLSYEHKWKIATSMEKFQLLAISTSSPHEIRVNNAVVPFKRQAKVLGFNLGPRGFSPHANNKINKAKGTLARLKRFKSASTEVQQHLYKMLVRPQLEYPPILMANLSKSKLDKMQSVQNSPLRRAFHLWPPYYNTSEDLHIQGGIEPLNTRLHRLGQKTWQNLTETDEPLVQQSLALSNANINDHGWWKRLAPLMEGDPPQPRYVR